MPLTNDGSAPEAAGGAPAGAAPAADGGAAVTGTDGIGARTAADTNAGTDADTATAGAGTSGADAPAPPAPAPEPPPKPATWAENPPRDPWAPEALDALLAASYAAHTADARRGDVHVAAARGPASWRAVGASRRGRLHAHRAEHREDALDVAAWPRGLALAVADGAGSARLSRIGAAVATGVAVASLHAALAPVAAPSRAALDAALDAALEAANAALRDLAERGALAPRDLRTTLLLAVIVAGTDASPDAAHVAALQVGDGVVALARSDGTVARLGDGDAGQFSGEVAHFLPDDGAVARGREVHVHAPLDDVQALLLASDGIEDPFYPIHRLGPPLVAQLAHGVTTPPDGFVQEPQASVLGAADTGAAHDAAAAERLLAWLQFTRRGENDDRTLVVAHRHPIAWPAPASA